MTTTVDIIENPSPDYFWDNYLSKRKPVILRGLVDKWPAYNKWNPSYLSSEYGDRLLPITKIVDGDYCDAERADMPIREYLEHLEREEEHSDIKLYLA